MESHKRYLHFAFDEYYPSGGLSDLQGTYDTMSEAIEAARKSDYQFQQIYDRTSGVEIDLSLYGVKAKPFQI